MIIHELLDVLQSKNIILNFADGKLKVFDAEKQLTADILAALKQHKQELIEIFSAGSGFTPSDFPYADIDQRQLDGWQKLYPNLENLYIAVPMQQGMLFHGLLDGTGQSYTGQSFYCVKGDFNLAAFKQAWQEAVNQYAIFRTCFVGFSTDQIHQLVVADCQLPYSELDWRHIPESQLEAEFEQFCQTDKAQGFDFSKPPLMRLTVIRLSENQYYVVWTHHHVMLDGWCQGEVFKSVLAHYQSFSLQQAPASIPVVPYERYIEWLYRQDKSAAKNFWREYLHGFAAATPLVLDKPSAPGSEKAIERYHFELDREATAGLERLARDSGCTANSVFQLAWSYLLSIYSGNDDVVFGATVAGRPPEVPGVDRILGLFINSIPLRVRFSRGCKIAEMLKQVQASAASCTSYDYYPLAEIKKVSELEGADALFESLVVFLNVGSGLGESGENRSVQLNGIEISKLGGDEYTNYTLTFGVRLGSTLRVRITYPTDRIATPQVELIAGHLQQVLSAFASTPDAVLEQVPVLTSTEKQYFDQQNRLAEKIAGQAQNFHTIQQRFEQAVQKHPAAPAVIYREQRRTYQELDSQANYLAHWLVEAGVQPGVLVGLCFGRSLEMLQALLAVQKVGAGYVPIDPEYPADRVAYIVQDCELGLVLTCSAIDLQLPASTQRVDVDVLLRAAVHNPTAPEVGPAALKPENPAYVIYTSGSTGMPKGVVVSQANFNNFYYAFLEQLAQLRADNSAWLWHTAYTFDASLKGLVCLCAGFGVVLADDVQAKNPDELVALLQYHRLSVFNAMPLLLEQVFERIQQHQVPGVNLISSGDVMSQSLWDRVASYANQHQLRAINAYGPTETTVNASYAMVQSGAPANIGHPVVNAAAYVLSPGLQRLPVGVPGELCISGDLVVAGYLNQPEQTESAFIPNPFVQDGSVLYRTGDVVQYLEDGSLQFLGRRDDQVKIRGYRIELREIEHNILQSDVVEQVVVGVELTASEAKQIVAYVVPKMGLTAEDLAAQLHDYLAKRLPEYMLPARYLALAELPTTSAGKVDRKALAEYSLVESGPGKEYVAPRNAQERQLVDLWQAVLKLEQIGIDDDFFDLGGDSIISMQLMAKAKRQGIYFSVRQLFSARTVRVLAETLAPEEQSAHDQTASTGEQILLPVQHEFFQREGGLREHFNQSIMLVTPGGFDCAVLTPIISALYVRHDALRLRFECNADQWQATYGAADQELLAAAVIRVDLTPVASLERAKAIEQEAQRWQSSLNLARGELLRAVYFDCGADEPGRLLLILHHLVVDGVSWRILVSDFEQAYRQISSAQAIDLPPKTESFQRWAKVLTDYAQQPEGLDRQRDYWRHILNHPVANLFSGDSAAASTQADLRGMALQLDKPQTAALLQHCHQAYHTEINELLLAGIGLALHRWKGAQAFRLILESHGREAPASDLDVSETVGWFTSKFPVLLELGQGTVAAAILNTRRQLRNVPAAGVGYGLLRYLIQDEAIIAAAQRAAECSDLLFNYLGQVDQNGTADSVFSLATENMGRQASADWALTNKLRITGLVVKDRLQLKIGYCCKTYQEADIAEFKQALQQSLAALIKHCGEQQNGIHQQIFQPEVLNNIALRMNESTADHAVFAAHPVSGSSVLYSHLAARLEDSMGFYGLQLPDLFSAVETREIPELAAAYVDVIRDIQAHGPYCLLGWSSGGAIAYEIAHQLELQGCAVAFLGIFDQPYRRSADIAQRISDKPLAVIQGFYQDRLAIDWDNLNRLPQNQALEQLLQAIDRQNVRPEGIDDALIKKYFQLLISFPPIMDSYAAPATNLDIVLYKVAAQDQTRMEKYGNALGWDQVSQGGITIVDAAGDHTNMVLPPHVESLAADLQTRLIQSIKQYEDKQAG